MADGPVVAVGGAAYRSVAPELARPPVTATSRAWCTRSGPAPS
ncbi:hypothetical protein [Micromonospora sp. DT47]